MERHSVLDEMRSLLRAMGELEREKNRLKCCGNCVHYGMRTSFFFENGASKSLLCSVYREGYGPNMPWMVCDEWKFKGPTNKDMEG